MATGYSGSIAKRTAAMVDAAEKLGKKIKIDWKEDTDAAIKAEQEKKPFTIPCQKAQSAKEQGIETGIVAIKFNLLSVDRYTGLHWWDWSIISTHSFREALLFCMVSA
jgi:hypothetical protein